MSDVGDSSDPSARDQGWLFASPDEDAEAGVPRAPGAKRLGKGLATLLDEAGEAPVSLGDVAVFGPGSVIQLSSCADEEPEYEPPPPLPEAPARAAPPPPSPVVVDELVEESVTVVDEVVEETVTVVDEVAPSAEDVGAAPFLIDDEVFDLGMPDVELE